MIKKTEEVLKDLKAKQYEFVYFLQGEEPYFIDQISNYIEENVLSETEKGFNQSIFYGKEAAMEQVITAARRFPMMSERQVVIVKEAQESPDLNREKGQKLIEDYLSNPQPSTILVFCYKYKTLDSRKSLSKSFANNAVLVSTKKPYDNQIPAWIESYVNSIGFQIEPKATFLLTENLGNNLERIVNEVDKMALNMGDEKVINSMMVEKNVGINKDFNIFELQKALIKKDSFKAQQIAGYFAANSKKNPIVMVIGSLFSFFSKILIVHQTADKSDRSLASTLRVSPFFIKDYANAAHTYPIPKVLINIRHIRDADLISKGVDHGSLPENQILKELIFKLMH